MLNVCLLLKLLHRLHVAADSAWAQWARQHISLATLNGDLSGSHWEALRSLLPLYQAVTTVSIGDGTRTSFWYDAWVDDEALADHFPALHSHCAHKGLSIAQLQSCGIDCSQLWVPRLSQQAMSELDEVRSILEQSSTTAEPDSCQGPFCLPCGKFDSGSLYRLLKSKDGQPQPAASFIWESRAPRRVQFFMYLLSQRRIQCRVNLLRKKVLDSAVCEVCSSDVETSEHVVFGCHFAKEFWEKLGFSLPVDCSALFDDLSSFQRPSHIPGNTLALSLLFAAGSFGNVGMGWSSDQKTQQSGIH